jgi:hypothetical protein
VRNRTITAAAGRTAHSPRAFLSTGRGGTPGSSTESSRSSARGPPVGICPSAPLGTVRTAPSSKPSAAKSSGVGISRFLRCLTRKRSSPVRSRTSVPSLGTSGTSARAPSGTTWTLAQSNPDAKNSSALGIQNLASARITYTCGADCSFTSEPSLRPSSTSGSMMGSGSRGGIVSYLIEIRITARPSEATLAVISSPNHGGTALAGPWNSQRGRRARDCVSGLRFCAAPRRPKTRG